MIVGVFDQALYANTAEVTWKRPDKFKTTSILRLGVFHTICTLLAIVGKRFQDAGLRDLCIESGVNANGALPGVMDGSSAWKGFLSWLQANHTDDVVHMDETMNATSNLCKDVSQASLKQVLQNKSCARIMYLYEVYLEYLRVGSGSLSTCWLSYLVEILLGLLRASREEHWMLHMASIHAVTHLPLVLRI